MRQIGELIQKWDGHIPSPTYGPDGGELLSSKVRRAVAASAAQKQAEAENPRLREERERRMAEQVAEERRRTSAEHEIRFWDGQEAALRAMGLRNRELELVANMEPWPAVQAVRAWLKGERRFLTIGGLPGSGKTIAAASICLEAKELFRSESFEGWFWRPGWCQFAKAPQLARCSYYSTQDREYLERLGVVKWLVLDDLGTEQTSSTWSATLAELIDERARNNVRTVITTNLSSKALAERYDARVMRRLKDFGEFIAAQRMEKAA